jgi:hypothetical protein
VNFTECLRPGGLQAGPQRLRGRSLPVSVQLCIGNRGPGARSGLVVAEGETLNIAKSEGPTRLSTSHPSSDSHTHHQTHMSVG